MQSLALAAQELAASPSVLSEVVVTTFGAPDKDQEVDTYGIGAERIDTMAEGPNSAFNRVLVQVPGVSQDSAGEVHFREEDPYYQFYADGVLLPRSIDGFGQDVDTPFVDSVSFKVGALPAVYAWGDYGIIAVQTKTVAALDGKQLSTYGGSHDTYRVDYSSGGTSQKIDYFVSSSHLHDGLGIENPIGERRGFYGGLSLIY